MTLRVVPPRTQNNFTSEITYTGGLVRKRITFPKLMGIKDPKELDRIAEELYRREFYWLTRLHPSGICPELTGANDAQRTLIMRYAGEPVTDENRPADYYRQLCHIHQQLLRFRCFYNDWKQENILVLDGKVRLIDYGWCPVIEEDYTCNGAIKTDRKEKLGGELWM